MMQEENHIFQGLRRDNHQIRQEANFLWDAHNIRLTDREDSTLMSITNEKGTLYTGVQLEGLYVGHCVLGKYLVVFTSQDDASDNYIYRIEKVGGRYETVILFHEKDATPVSWNPSNPIETLGVYETSLVQKVYWVDGVNQPRVINIVAENTDYTINSFDFVQKLALTEKVEVSTSYTDGMFAPGTIQYAFTYYNKYGQESNIFYTTPLNYITCKDRGGSPEERLSNSFNIKVRNLDKRFQYIRIYSIQRTSIDAIPAVKRVIDIPFSNTTEISYIDIGTTGEAVDPQFLLYVGGRDIVAHTLCAKDNTLFLGGLELKDNSEWLKVKKEIYNRLSGSDSWKSIVSNINVIPTLSQGSYYGYEINPGFSGFKTGETYRCGIQFQSENGTWSEPVFLKDGVLTDTYPYVSPYISEWHSQEVQLNRELVSYLVSKGYKKARACVVFPSALDRTVICQGVLCPTVYSVRDRTNAAPYAMSSWFFRPQCYTDSNNNSAILKGSYIQYHHNKPLLTGPDRGAEVQCTPYNTRIRSVEDINDSVEQSSYFFVDSNIVTFHSPDVEFDTSVQNIVFDDQLELHILGDMSLGAISGDIDIQTSSPTISSKAQGFNHKMIGYSMGDTVGTQINGGLVSGGFYQDTLATVGNDAYDDNGSLYYLIYPWHRSGSLNNSPRVEGVQSAMLSKKKISNLKFFDSFTPAENSLVYPIGTPQLFNSDQVSMVKVWVEYLQKSVAYYGNVDTMMTPSKDGYRIYSSTYFNGVIGDTPEVWGGEDDEDKTVLSLGSDPVRIKYKSTPHLVFSLKDPSTPWWHKRIPVIPGKGEQTIGDTYRIPSWDIIGNAAKEEEKNPEMCAWVANYVVLHAYKFRAKDIGKYIYISTTKSFAKCIGEGSGANAYSISAATAELRAGTILKIPGDGDSFWEYTDWYKGNDLYKKLVNCSVKDGVFYSEFEDTEAPEKTDSSTSRSFTINRQRLNTSQTQFAPFLVLAELRRPNVTNRFGGNSEEALRNNLWLPAGEPVYLEVPDDSPALGVGFIYGDTWYSRYDCLKTYPFTQEDENSVIEIGSFPCETRVNIDGRYDKNRGQLSNLYMSPLNFNLLNEVYSQKNNFFNYRIFEDSYYKENKYLNQITWTLEKNAGSDTDTWTNITLANTLDLDGEKGNVTAIRAWNEYLIGFQQKSVNQILFNNRVQIATTDGVPIEIANSAKVEGTRVFNGNIGCTDKWTICDSPIGMYFLDSITDSLYLFNGQLSNLSNTSGMHWWTKAIHTDRTWSPVGDSVSNGIRTFYDKKYMDVYFTPGPVTGEPVDALCYSEQIGQFTSFMSYGGTQAMFNFADDFYSLRDKNGKLTLYVNNAGKYNEFYGEVKGWNLSFISNQNPGITKVFDTIELRADCYDPDNPATPLYSSPVNYMAVDNEYQHSGRVTVNNNNMRKKFRIWRGLLPRNKGTRQRIRNPWSMITLGWDSTENQDEDNRKAVIHDISVKYTV